MLLLQNTKEKKKQIQNKFSPIEQGGTYYCPVLR